MQACLRRRLVLGYGLNGNAFVPRVSHFDAPQCASVGFQRAAGGGERGLHGPFLVTAFQFDADGFTGRMGLQRCTGFPGMVQDVIINADHHIARPDVCGVGGRTWGDFDNHQAICGPVFQRHTQVAGESGPCRLVGLNHSRDGAVEGHKAGKIGICGPAGHGHQADEEKHSMQHRPMNAAKPRIAQQI